MASTNDISQDKMTSLSTAHEASRAVGA